ncbi:glycosyltransferase family 4 protein [Oryzihumus leptocrescens]|uniref:Glycosyltransferase involved in cell wall biosynthesis n=1 Tax=Oryzihumus leptocrescens TaxID=297536 RepID=A0A542ZI16_9MICO|nr:glycosyltransferase family 1 protein [Oryzihumus leptocrescens]TQL59985.1 glycosyltransferase involved in cell wall biosynthesis [Oryzihumus leptocrescens]
MDVGLVVEQCRAAVPGGTGRYTAELAQALMAAAEGTASLTGWVAEAVRAPELGLPIRSLHLAPQALARVWERGLGPGIRGADVVHAPTLLVPPRRRGQQLVVTIHDVVPWTHPETLTPRGVRFHQRMGARAAREASLVLTPTEAVAAQVRTILDPRAEVRALPPGRSSLPVPDDPTAVRAALGIEPGPYVLFVGTAEPRKGLDVLLEAFAEPVLAGCRLVVAGPSGWGGVDVQAQARSRGLEPVVHVTGRVTDTELAALYAGAAALAMPSRAEGFGLPVLEAMSCGVPVVTSDDPALVEVGAGATLVAPVGDHACLAQQLATAVNEPSPGGRLAAMGRTRSADFDWQATGRSLWSLYRGL